MSVGRARWGVLVAAAFVAAATGCGGSGDKAGGEGEHDATVLTFATHDRGYAHHSFAEAVRRLSRGSLRIAVRDRGRNGHAFTPGVGLASMRERAAEVGGTVSVTRTDHGACVEATLPIG